MTIQISSSIQIRLFSIQAVHSNSKSSYSISIQVFKNLDEYLGIWGSYDRVNILKYSDLNWILNFLNERIYKYSDLKWTSIWVYSKIRQSTNLRINKRRMQHYPKILEKGWSNITILNEEFDSKWISWARLASLDNRGDSTSLNERIPSPFAERNYGGQSVRKRKRWLLFVASSLCTVESTSFRSARRG